MKDVLIYKKMGVICSQKNLLAWKDLRAAKLITQPAALIQKDQADASRCFISSK